MISFSLVCDAGHEFEGWFRGGADFDDQKGRGLLTCPACRSAKVEKRLMAPAVATGRTREKVALAAGAEQRRLLSELKAAAARLRETSDNVGDRFAEEARKIHFGEAESRSIHGEATGEEARALAEDGVPFMPLPVFPDDHN